MPRLTDLLPPLFQRRYHGATGRDPRSTEALCRDLLSSHGEVTGGEMARHILDRYAEADEETRRAFFELLAEFDVDADALAEAVRDYAEDRSRGRYQVLARAAEPQRQELARRLNQVPGATVRLVRMRADLLRFAREHPDLERVDVDFRHLFASWFNRGFLVLQRITWESPANVLEKIIAYEAVHAIGSWADLRRRLEPPDRRCYAFFHPAMPTEPLIFVEVALTRGIPGSVQSLLAEGRTPLPPGRADTAVFYSISNCQPGLAGISFGNSLIKQVVEDISREVPEIGNFVTLSPIPRLRAWAEEEEIDLPEDPDELRRVAARYLLTAKRGNAPYDPVARFHLGNGARVHEIHAGADTSDAGIRQSGGAMVNYLYDPGRIASNHEAFAGEGRVIASRSVQGLARAAENRRARQKESEKT
ncbi:malonyl-CoA decarboxylase [Roseitranquillus sediminis]|uniref:malonyl-CoA decarboxylase n=1 Tax=Roseitranquillus sediminis TaxID=2809051 RepID=UPI001D0C1033|nr:malonyl-CoA decarboxylase [Roseitranquillus sediminis]MBM9593233.1 malonyl-CoA decarboxylase [Roseitranquillus sediminis]